ncbi:SMI1/KNR4 family protein [Bacillus sp. ILBB4]|nr:SMI1/KNR4 family protein [Bacillus sp. ILBB4]
MWHKEEYLSIFKIKYRKRRHSTSDYYIEEWDLPKDILLLSGEGHWWVAFDYRNTKDNPPIIYMDLEWGTDTLIFELAPNCETFVNGLFIYECEE